MRDHFGGKARMAAAGKTRALAHAAQVDNGPDVEPVDQIEIGIAGFHVLARTEQQTRFYPPPARHGISAVIAQVMDTFGRQERSNGRGSGSSVTNHRGRQWQRRVTGARRALPHRQ
jgi:hypothetical protein